MTDRIGLAERMMGDEAVRHESEPWSILVVDDDVPVARLAARLLERMGHRATVLNSPIEALELLRSSSDQFDAVITDHRMPGMTGLTMVRAVREAGIRIPILIVSGYGEELTPESLNALGVGAVLNKPYSRVDLAARLEGLLPSSPSPKPVD